MPQFLTNVIHADATNVALGTTTGTKIGTATAQKLGFYNATPLIQPSGSLTAALTNLGLITSPTIAESDVTNLVTDLAAKSPVATTDYLMPLAQATVSIAGGTTLSAAAFGRLHVCSGTSANYTVTLPSPTTNGGKFIGLIMAPGLTKLVTILRNASDLIDGATSRVLWANEVATLFCDGTHWTKIAGKAVPMICQLTLNANQTIPHAAFTAIAFDRLVQDNTGLMADLTNHRVLINRPGTYAAAAWAFWNGMATASSNTQIRIQRNAADEATTVLLPVPQFAAPSMAVSYIRAGTAATDLYTVNAYQSSGAGSDLGSGGSSTSILISEVLTW